MKKLIALAALALCSSAFAQTVILEYDFNNYQHSKEFVHYGAIGLAVSTKYGTFDGYVQASRYKGSYTDNINGYEFGYSKTFTYGKLNFVPRTAFGDMTDIAVSPTKNIEAFYNLSSVEINTALTENYGVFFGLSQMRGLNRDAISVSNRVLTGVDLFIDQKNAFRLSYSSIRQLHTIQNGLQVVYSYSF